MEAAKSTNPTRERKEHWRFPIIICAPLALALIWISILAISKHRGVASTATNAGHIGLRPATESSSARRFDDMAVFEEFARPALLRLQENDAEAVRRAIARIHGHFDSARAGAPAFTQSLIGPLNEVKTTYLAGKGEFQRWWYKDPQIQPVANHVRWNYEQHVTSGPKIRDAILAAVAQLEQDFRANRNEALQTIHSNLRAANLPASVEINQKQLDEFCQQEFEAAMQGVNTEHVAERDAVGSAAGFVLSAAATIVVERAIIYVVDDIAATAGGSVVTGAAGGAAAGSWIPGAGTAIGAVAGLLAGGAAEAWLRHRDEERTTKQVVTSLTQIEEGIIRGDGGHPGVEKILNDAASQQSQQLGTKLRDQLQEAAR